MIFLLIIGFILLIKGADFIVKGATDLAKKMRISEMVIGILIVGIGTSLPEILITIKSAIMGKPDIVIGNGIGSSICNILLVVGIASICKPVKIDKRIIKIHFPLLIISIILLSIFCNFGGKSQITKVEAVTLILFTIGYITYTLYEGKKENLSNKINSNRSEENNDNVKIIRIFFSLLIGALFLKYGADFVVDGATKIATRLNISESIVGITIIAIGTSLPEIITSLVASKNKKSDLALGNVIGSNIFNICLLPGIGGIISPINYDNGFNISLLFLAVVIVEIIIIQKLEKKYVIERKKGIALSFIYFLYTIRMILT